MYNNKIDFRKNPYKGIFKRVMEKTGANSIQAVHRAYRIGNLRIIELVNQEIEAVENIINRNTELTGREPRVIAS